MTMSIVGKVLTRSRLLPWANLDGLHTLTLTKICLTASSRSLSTSSPSSAKSGRLDDATTAAAVVVYRGPLTSFVRATKFFSLTTSVMGLTAQPFLFSAATTLSSVALAGGGVLVLFFTYVTPVVLHLITKKYVTEMRFEPRSRVFTATTLSFFLRPKRLHFRAADVRVPDVPGPFTSFLANETPLMVDFKQFTDIDTYRHLMGYDKPIDLELSGQEKQN